MAKAELRLLLFFDGSRMTPQSASRIKHGIAVSACLLIVAVATCFGMRYRTNTQTEKVFSQSFHRFAGLEYSIDAPEWLEDILHRVGVESRGDPAGAILGVPVTLLLDTDRLSSDEQRCLNRIAKHLRQVILSGSDLTDENLASFADNRALQVLLIHGTQVRGHGLRHLSGCSQLEVLGLSNTGLDDSHLDHLAALPNLKILHAGRTLVTAAGVQRLSSLPQLQTLSLIGCTRLDVRLVDWSRFQALKELFIEQALTDEEQTRLTISLLPNCKVIGLECDLGPEPELGEPPFDQNQNSPMAF